MRALGEYLHPVYGSVVRETPVTAVHSSELVDPTSYVSGGELVLTTGLILPTSMVDASDGSRRVNGVLQPLGATQ